jgi:Pro-kumamolisin, activation domain/Subtilase family
MRWTRLSLAFLACLALAWALAPAGASAASVRVGTAPTLPPGASSAGAVSPERPLNLYVALEPSDPAGLEAFATEVSTPGSPAYGQYLSVPGFAARFGATPAQVATVRSALLARGLQVGEPSANDLSLPVSATAAEAEAAFGTELERVRTADGRLAYANTSAPRIGAAAAPYVAGVIGLADLNVPERQPVEPAASAAAEGSEGTGAAGASTAGVLTGGPQPCAELLTTQAEERAGYTADQVASAYSLSGFYAAGDLGAGQTVALLELEPFLPEDIAAYQACYGTQTPVEAVDVEGGPGPYEGEDGEAALDIEQLIGLAPDARVRVYQGPNSASVPILSAFVTDNVAKVMSSSWGLCEKYTGREEVVAFDALLQEAAAQGQSFFVASGDTGSTDCYSSKNKTEKSLGVDYPGSDPFATDVGGTQMSTPSTPPVEYLWNTGTAEGAGGGGISARFAMPSYQATASPTLNVIGPLSTGTACASPTLCREVPDVSANAAPRTGYFVRAEGNWQVIGGTSAAAPLWAAFTALANASPACVGKSIGFANPALYAIAGAGYAGNFDDVVTSRPKGPKSTNLFGESAYEAGPYFDMATGLGTPVGSALGATLCAIAQPIPTPSPPTPTPAPAPAPAPPPAIPPQPHVSGAKLLGLAKGRPRLTLTVEAREGTNLESINLTLPSGLTPTRAKRSLAAGVLVRDEAGKPVKSKVDTIAKQTIRIRILRPVPTAKLTLHPPAIGVTAKLVKRVRRSATKSLGLIVAARESGGQSARYPLVLTP